MNTLNSIIDKIDSQLATAKESAESAALSPFLSGAQEKFRRYIQVKTGILSLAIPIDDMYEVGHLPDITRLPNLPRWILGIVNLREEIISVLDLNLLFFESASEVPKGQRLVVLQNNTMKVGIVIDRIIATISRPDSDRKVAPETILQKAAPSIFSECLESNEEVYHILEADSLFTFDRLINYYDA